MTTAKRRIRRDILKRRGLKVGSYGKVKPDLPDEPLATPNGDKTLAMRLMEQQLDRPIEDVLMLGSLTQVAAMLGVDPSTVSKWRLKLGLRSTVEGDEVEG